MRTGQKHNKINHVENIEKADVSCETMQNSPKSGRGKRPAGRWFAPKEGEALAAVKANVVARRSVWACARGGSVARQKKGGGEQGKHLKDGSPAEEQGRF